MVVGKRVGAGGVGGIDVAGDMIDLAEGAHLCSFVLLRITGLEGVEKVRMLRIVWGTWGPRHPLAGEKCLSGAGSSTTSLALNEGNDQGSRAPVS